MSRIAMAMILGVVTGHVIGLISIGITEHLRNRKHDGLGPLERLRLFFWNNVLTCRARMRLIGTRAERWILGY